MPSTSIKQQRLAGMADAYLKGGGSASPAVKKFAQMGPKRVKEFAKTRHTGLPMRRGKRGRGQRG